MSRIGRSRPHVRLVDHVHLAAAVALDAQGPARERGERLVQGLGAGRQRVVAVAAPVALGRLTSCHRPWHDGSVRETADSRVATPLALLGGQILHPARTGRTRVVWR